MVNGFNSRCLSRILNKDFRKTATHPDFDLVALVVKRRMRFAGHILRMEPDRLLRRTFIAYLNENPFPPGSLLHGCDGMTIEQLSRLARNRRKWSKFINSLNLWHLWRCCSIAPYRCLTRVSDICDVAVALHLRVPHTLCIMQYIHTYFLKNIYEYN